MHLMGDVKSRKDQGLSGAMQDVTIAWYGGILGSLGHEFGDFGTWKRVECGTMWYLYSECNHIENQDMAKRNE